jgi:hypothetical protein
MASEKRTKKIGIYFILFYGIVKDTWTTQGTRQRMFYEVSVHLKQKGALIERGDFDNREGALNAYRNMKTVSDVHKYLHRLNPTDRPLKHYDGRLKYNQR